MSLFTSRRTLPAAFLVVAAVLSTAALQAKPAALKPARILLYDGYGTRTEVVMRGRVVEDAAPSTNKKQNMFANAAQNLARLETNEVKFVPVQAELGGTLLGYRSNADGLFGSTVDLTLRPLPIGTHDAHALLTPPDSHYAPRTTAQVHVLSDTPLIVISDIDDTIVNSHVPNKPRLLVEAFLKNAAQLDVVASAPAAYRNADDAGVDLFMFVSGSPMPLWDRLRWFMSDQDFPRGPMFLKNLGDDPLFSHLEYKIGRIEELMATFPDGRFILIGDSGEKDPEIYAEVRRRHPKRIAHIIIRHAPGSDVPPARVTGMTIVKDYVGSEDLIADIARPLVRRPPEVSPAPPPRALQVPRVAPTAPE